MITGKLSDGGINTMKNGILYGVGVGPGDPSLMTLKAVELIRKCDILAVPGEIPEESMAYKIAVQSVPELAKKTVLPLPMPMNHDIKALSEQHKRNADIIMEHLDHNENVVFLTLGDPSIYSTYGYIRRIVAECGYKVHTVPGVTSFCAAAAALNTTLTEGSERLHIVPANEVENEDFSMPGTYVFMKPHKNMADLKEKLQNSGRALKAVEKCGLDGERIFADGEDISEDVGYFTLIIAK